MEKRACKKCGVEKIREYFTLNAKGRKMYKDETGKLWNGNTCYSCFKLYVKEKSGKKPLVQKQCSKCQVMFQQNNWKHTKCSRCSRPRSPSVKMTVDS